MVNLPEISEVLSAHPAVRRPETAIVRHQGRELTRECGTAGRLAAAFRELIG